MGKIPVKMRAVVYSLSPFQQKIMPGLWNDFTGKIHHKVSENWISTILLLGPLVGTYSYVQYYQEKESWSTGTKRTSCLQEIYAGSSVGLKKTL